MLYGDFSCSTKMLFQYNVLLIIRLSVLQITIDTRAKIFLDQSTTDY